MRTPRAAVLDFGGVMAQSPLSRLHWLADTFDCPRGVVVGTIFGDLDDAEDNPWRDAEMGACDLDEEFGRRMTIRFARHGASFDLATFVDWVAGAVNEPQVEIVDAVARLRTAGIATALLTNSVREFRPVIEATIDVEALFDVVVDSCEVGLRKPDPAIYLLTAGRLGLDPDQCVFVDDLADNVAGARAASMTALHLTDDPAGTAKSLFDLFDLP